MRPRNKTWGHFEVRVFMLAGENKRVGAKRHEVTQEIREALRMRALAF